MEFRPLGNSGLNVPVLSLGTGTFGGGSAFFKAWGNTDASGAARLVDICLEHGLNMFDSADIYSNGLAEEVLGRRNKVLISTKAAFRFSDEANDVGTSRYHLTAAIDGSLKRLGAEHIDLFQLHGFLPELRSKRRSRPWTVLLRPEKSGTSAAPITPGGT